MNSSFAYTNPYSQSSQNASSWQQQLRLFQQTTGVQPSLESVQRLYHHLQQQQQQQPGSTLEWPFPTARKFTDYCLRLVLDQHYQQQQDGVGANASPILPSLLFVTIKAMEQSEESLMYAIVVGEQSLTTRNEAETILQVYQELILKSSSSAISSVACVGLATTWRALDRLERYTSLHPCTADDTWWLQSLNKDLAAAAVEFLLRNELEFDLPTTQPFPMLEEIHMSCVGILLTLLKHNMTNWLFAVSDDQRLQLCQLLKSQAERLQLNDRSMSPSLHSLQLAISCASLLFLISWKYSVQDVEQWKVQWSNDMGRHIVRVAFPGANITPRGPRWTYESPATIRLLQPWAQELLLCCKLCGDDSLWTALDTRQWLPFWDMTWTKLLTENVTATPTIRKDLNLDSAYCLHLIQPQVTRRALVKVLAPESIGQESLVPACRHLVESLLLLSQSNKFSTAGPATAFLRRFLSEGRDVASQDEFARALWTSVNDGQFIDSLIEFASPDLSSGQETSSDITRPNLVVRLDVLGALAASQEVCSKALRQLGVQHMETLIHTMSPKDVRVDLTNSFDETHLGGDDEDTPPVNNLSRMDEKSLCIEHEQEHQPRGLDYAVRLSAATFLARLACATSSLDTSACDALCFDDDTRLVQARMRSAVGDFVSNQPTSFDSSGPPSTFDMTRRRLLLVVAYASQENVDLLVSALHSTEMLRNRHCDQLSEELESCRELLKEAKSRESAFEMERKAWKRDLTIKSIVVDRELARCKQRAADDANQLVKTHAAERARAECKAKELAKRLEESEVAIKEAEYRVQTHLQAEAETREALNAITGSMRELEIKFQEQQQLCADREAEAEQIASELESTSHLLSEAKEEQRMMQGHIDSKEEELATLRGSCTMLQDNLENLFADMVSLTQLYQMKEQEVVDARKKSDRSAQDLKEQLDKERRRNEELERKERETRHENEKLAKKLARSKEKLEAERKERQDESERRHRLGPVSYMNQLHNSTFSDRSGKDKTWEKSFNKKDSRW